LHLFVKRSFTGMTEAQGSRAKNQSTSEEVHRNQALDSSSLSTKPDHANAARVATPDSESTVPMIPRRNVPEWLSPFFSLRIQLVVAYTLVLLLIVLLVASLAYEHLSLLSAVLIAGGIIVLGLILVFVFTTLLLRPLWRITDAAQAIAVGDLEQRERLPLRLPPQDEVDRLAGSLNEMVLRLEHAEEMQHNAEERFRRFFSDASHQLRTPLTSIRGFTEVLMRGAKDDPETALRVLKRMKSEAERMTVLINALLTLSRLDDGQPLKTQYFDLADVAMEEIEQARAQAGDGRQIILERDTQQFLGVQADKERIKQLFFILLDNAIKHGRPAPDGTITLCLDRQEGKAIIRVIDNGDGIAKDDLDHIFDSFYRGRSISQGTPIIGAGLGLTIAQAIVRAHHGSIAFQSEPGRTEFTVALPCVD
jgi:signal transduction histidine kinase